MVLYNLIDYLIIKPLFISVYPAYKKNEAGFTTCPSLETRYTGEPNNRAVSRRPADIVRTRNPGACKYWEITFKENNYIACIGLHSAAAQCLTVNVMVVDSTFTRGLFSSLLSFLSLWRKRNVERVEFRHSTCNISKIGLKL